jgi:hypothetical protein
LNSNENEAVIEPDSKKGKFVYDVSIDMQNHPVHDPPKEKKGIQ